MPNSSDFPRLAEHLATAILATWRLGLRDRTLVISILRMTLDRHPGILSTWTVWEPGAFDGRDEEFANAEGHDSTGRLVACWHRASGKPALVPVVGYERPGTGDWYWIPRRTLSPCGVAPLEYRFGPHRVTITSHISPIVVDGKFYGVVGIDLPVAKQKPAPFHSPSVECRRHGALPLDLLSPREAEVFYWLKLGKSNEEIAIILSISPHTVKNHVEHIFQKLGVHTRYEAIAASSNFP